MEGNPPPSPKLPSKCMHIQMRPVEWHGCAGTE